jgi:vancomycin resistance protein YoaR
LIETANARVAKGITITTGQTKATINALSLREWTRLSPSQDNRTQVLTLDPVATQAAIEVGLAGANTAPTDASLSVTGSGIVVTPGAPGRQCCQDTSWATLSNALFDPNIANAPTNVVIATNEIAPTVTEAQLQSLGITEAVSTFTTKHPAGQPRVKNIHKVADLMRGKIIMPGKSLSVNEIVGERTLAKGYVMAPSIAEGKFSESPGGGISQFATTLFNAAFFAGMDLEKYQAHSIYISRYPYGREATLSWPSPDLQIGNPSPYGVLIWPTYTESSITVTLYSTKWVTATQTGQTKGTSGSCTTVRTTRSRVKVDGSGSLPEDSVRAVYRAQEGLNCGDEIPTTTIATPTTVAVTPTPTTAPATTPTTAAPVTTVPVTP